MHTAGAVIPPPAVYVETRRDAKEWLDHYMTLPRFAYDTETYGDKQWTRRIKFFSLSDGESRIAAPVRLLEVFRPLLEDPSKEICLHNRRFDEHVSWNHGVRIAGVVLCTMLMAYLNYSSERLDLKYQAEQVVGIRMNGFKETFGVPSSDAAWIYGDIHHVIDELEGAAQESAAFDLLIRMGVLRLSGDKKFEAMVKTVSAAQSAGEVLPAYNRSQKCLLKYARAMGMCGKTGGTAGYVVDWLRMTSLIGPDDTIPVKKRSSYVEILDLDAAEVQRRLYERISHQIEQQLDHSTSFIETLRELAIEYASLDAWATFKLAEALEARLMEAR